MGEGGGKAPIMTPQTRHTRSPCIAAVPLPHRRPAPPWSAVALQVPGLGPFKAALEEIYDRFNKYKRTVPVR